MRVVAEGQSTTCSLKVADRGPHGWCKTKHEVTEIGWWFYVLFLIYHRLTQIFDFSKNINIKNINIRGQRRSGAFAATTALLQDTRWTPTWWRSILGDDDHHHNHDQFITVWWYQMNNINIEQLKRRKNHECCPVSLLIVVSQWLSWIQVLNCLWKDNNFTSHVVSLS